MISNCDTASSIQLSGGAAVSRSIIAAIFRQNFSQSPHSLHDLECNSIFALTVAFRGPSVNESQFHSSYLLHVSISSLGYKTQYISVRFYKISAPELPPATFG